LATGSEKRSLSCSKPASSRISIISKVSCWKYSRELATATRT
jgi:hypothetical protein